MFLAYPYTDLYNLNLDWMIKAIKEVQEVIENLGSVVNTFNEREGNVVLTSEDVNSLEIDSVVTLPEGSFDTITEAQKTAYYEAGKRIIVALNTYGDYSRLGFLYKAGSAVGMAEYVPTQEEHAVLSFNGRTGRVTLNDSDVNNLQILPVLQLNGTDVSSLSTDQKLQYFDAGIRFIHCVPVQGGTITTQKLYTLNVNESGGTRIPYVTAYDPLQGQGLVKAVNSESPNTSGQLYLYADDIEMANDDDDTVYSRITDLESAAVESVNGVTPSQGDVVITGGDIQVAADDDTTIDEFASDVYSELEDRVKSVNGVTPDAAGSVTVYGTGVAMSSTDATTIKAAIDACEKKTVNGVTYTRGTIVIDDSAEASAYTDSELLQAVYNAIPNSGMQIIDILAYSSKTIARRHVTGYRYVNYGYLTMHRGNATLPMPLTLQIVSDVGTPMITAGEFLYSYSEVEDKATRAYAVGDIVAWKNHIGKVLQALAIGADLNSSSNVQKWDTIGGALNNIKQAIVTRTVPASYIEVSAGNTNTGIELNAGNIITLVITTDSTNPASKRMYVTVMINFTAEWFNILCGHEQTVYTLQMRIYNGTLQTNQLIKVADGTVSNFYITSYSIM